MPILVIKNESGLDETIELSEALPSQPLFLKTIAWNYVPATTGNNAKFGPQGEDDWTTWSNANDNPISVINAKIEFLDNFDINSTTGQGGMIPIPINNIGKGVITVDWEFLPAVNVSKVVDLKLFIGDLPLANYLNAGDRFHTMFVFSYGTNRRI